MLKTTFPLLLIASVWINLELFFKYQSSLQPLYLEGLWCLQDHSILEIAGHLQQVPGCDLVFVFYHGVQQWDKCFTMQLWKQSKNSKIKTTVYIPHFICDVLFTP